MNLSRLLMLSTLALLFAAFSTPGQQQAPATSGWQQTQKADATHSTAQFALAGKFLTPPQKDPGSPPLLLVNCKPLRSRRKFSTSSVNVGTQLKVEYVEPDEIKAGIRSPATYTVEQCVRDWLDSLTIEKWDAWWGEAKR